MATPIIITPPPPPPPPDKPKRFELTADAGYWLRKWSTWLAALSASAAAGLGVYAVLPVRVQALFPDWALLSLGGIAVGAAMLVPLATSIQQKSIPVRGPAP